MKSLLMITSSPRGENSHSNQLAEHFVNELGSHGSSWQIDTIDLWQQALPAMSGDTLSAKYAVFEGQALSREQNESWQVIESLVEKFSQATAVAFALPVWNFGVPYVLKHYIDVITQPGLSFSWSIESGYTSLLPRKQAVIFNSSAGDYRLGGENEADDYCLSYLKHWLTVYMACEAQVISASPTVHSPEIVNSAKENAYKQATILAEELNQSEWN